MKTGTPLAFHGKKCCHSICCFQKRKLTFFFVSVCGYSLSVLFLGRQLRREYKISS